MTHEVIRLHRQRNTHVQLCCLLSLQNWYNLFGLFPDFYIPKNTFQSSVYCLQSEMVLSPSLPLCVEYQSFSWFTQCFYVRIGHSHDKVKRNQVKALIRSWLMPFVFICMPLCEVLTVVTIYYRSEYNQTSSQTMSLSLCSVCVCCKTCQ